MIGGSDAEADAVLHNTHLMRLAGRFARRVRAWAADNAVGFTVADFTAKVRAMTGQAGYTLRNAAYDLRKPR